MIQPSEDLPKKRGRKIIFNDEIHNAWRIAAQYKYEQKKAKRKVV